MSTSANAVAVPPCSRTFGAPKSPFGAFQLMLHKQEMTTDGHAPLVQELEKVGNFEWCNNSDECGG